MLATAGILWVEGFGSIPGFPEGKGLSQMDVFWDVWAEKPNYIVASIVFFTVIEVISGIATTKGRESGLREAGDFTFNPLEFKVNLPALPLPQGYRAPPSPLDPTVSAPPAGHR